MSSGYIDLPTNAGGAPVITSIGLSAPASILSVGGSPLTSNGTLTLSLATQVKNRVWAGPASGADANPTFRLLVVADMPAAGATGSFTSADSKTVTVTNGLITAIV